MTTERQDIPPKQAAQLTFSEALHHYFALGDALCDAKVKGDKTTAGALQRVVDALLSDITKTADEAGFGKQFRDAIWNDRAVRRNVLCG